MTSIALQLVLMVYFLAMVIGDLVLLAQERRKAIASSGDGDESADASSRSRRHRSSRSRRRPFHFVLHVVLAAMAIIVTLDSIEDYGEKATDEQID